MIRLIRIDGIEILLNSDLIKTIEENGETVITLANEEKIAVKNPKKDVIQKIRAFRIGKSEAKKDREEKPKGKDTK